MEDELEAEVNDDAEEIRTILDELADKFQNLVHWIKTTLPPAERQRYLNPEVLGGMSCFLGIGEGWEPAFYKGGKSDDLVEWMTPQL